MVQPPGPTPPPRGYADGVTTAGFPTGTALLLLVSAVSVVLVGIVGIPSAVIAVLAWRQDARDPVGARRRTRTGWVTYAVNLVVGVLLLVPFYAWALQNR